MYKVSKKTYNNKNEYKFKRRKIMKIIDKIALVLIIIGAINWGLIGLFGFDLVATLFGNMQ